MKARRWALPVAAGIVVVVLARGCYGNWLFGIVESFGLPNGAIITTVAGNGTAGYSGDNEPATAAELDQPSGVAVDSAGNLYIADSNNSVIRKVDTSGRITTLAGSHVAGFLNGTKSSAEFNNPLSVAVDSAGDVFVADAGNNMIREVTGTAVSTIAGSVTPGSTGDGGLATSAELNLPTGVAVDAAGDVFVADFNNSVIREVYYSANYSTSDINTVAGSLSLGPGYLGDGGLATKAKLNYPYGVTVDSSGNVYVADTTNAVIRKFTVGGNIYTIAGNGVVGFGGDGGPALSASIDLPTSLAVDHFGNLFIADRNNNVIRRVDPSGNITTVAGNWHLGRGYAGDGNVATSAMLSLPWGVAVDSSGNLYIADTYNNRIRKVTFAR